jgi:lipid IVA palmitoyltransferase
MKKNWLFCIGFCGSFLSQTSLAACEGSYEFIQSFCNTIQNTWEKGDQTLYIPFHAHHLRFAYTQEKIDSYREDSLGLGYGRHLYVDDQWESVYGMAFLDSNDHIEPVIGYAREWMWGHKESLNAGLGYTTFITMRPDVFHNLPFPAAAPIASVAYNHVSLNGAYLVGGQGNGNILFFWSTFGF